MSNSWQQYLKEEKKCIFSSFIHISETTEQNNFYYVNEGKETERLVAIILTPDGKIPFNLTPLVYKLATGESLKIDANKILLQIGITNFQGSFLLIASNHDSEKPFNFSLKDLVTTWLGKDACTQIGVGGIRYFNVTGWKEKKSYYMFCPAVLSNNKRKTLITIFNHSTEHSYNDTVQLIPKLHNLDGETIIGKELSMPPFGCGIIDVDDHFGEEGKRLLQKTNGRGSLTTSHKGHTFSSLFFHIEKENNTIISGRHTQPPELTVFRQPNYNYWVAYLGERVPFAGHIVPIVSYLKKHPKIYRTFYAHRSNYLPNWYSWLKQSRWSVYLQTMLRAVYFLLKSKFKIKQIKIYNKSSLNKEVINHNLWNELKLFQFSRGRIERLLYPLKSLASFQPHGKTLCIGPKNEGEIILLKMHGLTDVIGIDLFSYCPTIKLMDMHYMSFKDNTFDTIFCGWVLKYSYDLKKAVDEIIRVSKDSALITCSFGIALDKNEELEFVTTHLAGGVGELLNLFGDTVGHVYWRDEDIVKGGKTKNGIVIFKLKKQL